MKYILFLMFSFATSILIAQELYVFTEPASNMASKSIGVRVTNYLTNDKHYSKNKYFLNPELMWGVSKKIMIHANAFLSNINDAFLLNGGGIYLKYRFFSRDAVHSHFRAAAFAKYSWTNNKIIHDYYIELNNHNTGYQAGLVVTKLIHKIAFSASTSLLHADNNINTKFLLGNQFRNAINYTLSVGKLMLPREYTSYKQTNMNCMIELLGQTNIHNGYVNLDIAPSVQLIFNSKMRVDIGYRYPLVTKLQRFMDKGILFRIEYNFFNAY